MKEQHDPLHMMDALLGLKTQLTAAKARAEQAEAQAAQLAALLQEWLTTPFFASAADWQDWVLEFRPRVEAALTASPAATAAADVLRAIRKTWESIWPPESNVELIEAIDKWLATDKDQS